ncbi:MAG: tripartite tricarboxylate transporter substrate binding protein [Burkholderiales bacterium]
MKIPAVLALAAAGALGAGGAFAQAWPSKPVRVIVPFGAGGGTDIQGRLLSKKFYESMGQTFVIENRTGGGGMIGAELAAKAPPDGSVILFTTASLAVGATLYPKLGYDPVKDLAPVSWVSSVPLVLAVHPSVPAKSVKELVALAKARKGQMNGASNGSGTTSHLALELLKDTGGIQVTHIPYKGGGPATLAVVSGETDFVFTTILSVYPQVKAGRMRGLAVTTAKRSSVAPEMPTMGETFPGFEIDNWYAMFVPTGTPKEIVTKLHAELMKAMKSQEVVDFMVKDGADPVGSTPEQLAAYYAKEVQKYAKLIKQGNVKPE